MIGYLKRIKDLEQRVEALEQEALHGTARCRHGRVRDKGTFGAPNLTCLECGQSVAPENVPDDAEIEA